MAEIEIVNINVINAGKKIRQNIILKKIVNVWFKEWSKDKDVLILKECRIKDG